MSVTTETAADGKMVTIRVHENFDYDVHRQFRAAYSGGPGHGCAFVVDLQDADKMDSSALAMLLLLREHAGADAADIRIINCSNNAKKVFKVANFDTLFKIL